MRTPGCPWRTSSEKSEVALRCVAHCPGPRSGENRAPDVPRLAGGLVCLGWARFLPAVLGGQPVERRVHSAGSRVPALILFFLELDCVMFSLTGNSCGRICRLLHARCGGFQDSRWAQRPTPCLTSGRCRHPRRQRHTLPSPRQPRPSLLSVCFCGPACWAVSLRCDAHRASRTLCSQVTEVSGERAASCSPVIS